MADDLTDLIERLERAVVELNQLADAPVTTTDEHRRLAAKASGVSLALSYAREYQRQGPRAELLDLLSTRRGHDAATH